MSIWISILLITFCAFFWDIGVVLQKQAADKLPRLVIDRGIFKVLRAFITSKKWIGGLIFSGAGWGLFAFVLNYTPVSLARAIQGSGFVVLAFFSIFFLNHKLTIWEWAGVIICTGGIVALGVSESAGNQTPSEIIPSRLITTVVLSSVVCLLIYKAQKLFNCGFKWVVVFSIFAGVMLGTGDVLTKGILIETGKKFYAIGFGVIFPAMIFFYLLGLFFLSRAYQHGRAILVTAVSDFSSRLIAIFLGVYALGEVFPEEILYRDMRILGLAAVLSGTLLLGRFSGEEVGEELKKV
ncbi:MAG: hypothetical protein DRP89_09010 [Candidatus Neomarinimicrobiota bacterium]|nr:MAG: hypothetical protein DRP89_09010 [Candidatus Neomarinimicrobiota bacterium]